MSAINKLLSKRKKKKTNDLTPTGSAANNGTDVSENKRHDKILMYLDPVIEMVNITKEAAELLPPLKLACGVTIRILTIVRGMVKNDADWNILVKRLEPYSEYLTRQYRKIEETQQIVGPYLNDPDFKNALDSFLRTLNKIQAKAMDDSERFNKKKAKTYLTQAMKVKNQMENIQGLGVELDRDYERLKGEIISCIHSLTLRIQTQTSQIQIFQKLNSVNARGERIIPLTAGTRSVVLERLLLWARSPLSEEQIFWLCDEAGTGKSTVAGEMVRRWRAEGRLAARFFFDGQEQFTRTLDRFCVTVAKEVLENHPRCEHILSSIIEKHRDLDSLDFESKFQALNSDLLEHLAKHKRLDDQPLPLVIVIDSLDECIIEDRARLMKALTGSLPSAEIVKVFLTSRSLPDIERGLGTSTIVGGRDLLLLDIKSADRDKDIAIYVKAILGERFSPQLQKSVVDSSNGLFLSASLTCSALLKKSPSKASHAKLLARLENMTPNDTFRELYQTVLEVALVDDDEVEIIIAVLKGVALPFQPISIYTIGTFFPLEDEEDTISCIDFYVQRLGSIMKDGTPYLPVHLVHPTFRVYLETLNPDSTFYFPFQPGHAQIAFVCLELLCSTLTYDICGLEKHNEPLPTSNILALPDVLPSVLTSDTTSPLRYAVSFWMHHASSNLDNLEIISRMKIFFEKHLLCWLEWASILGVMSDVLHGLKKMWNEMKVPLSTDALNLDDTISNWCLDALHFVQRHQEVISQSGMQTYTSALAFSPLSSSIHRHYARNPIHPIPTVQGDVRPSSPAHRILDSGYRLSFAMCAFLAGGKQLVCIGARRGQLQIWDIASGKCHSQIPGHDGRWNAGAYSRDGSLIASGSSNGTICLWDIYGGTLLAGPYPADPQHVSALAFTSGDKILASGGFDGAIKLWNVSALGKKPKRPTCTTLPGHTNGVSALTASPVSELLASGSFDHTVRLWDINSSPPKMVVLSGHTRSVTGMVFSGDGKRIASGSMDGSVRLWDAINGVQLATLIENGVSIDSLILAPDKDTIFASSNNGEVHRWKMSTQESSGAVLKEHTGRVTSMKVTPNGRYLTTGSHDHTVRVWDLFTDPPPSVGLRGNTDNVFEVTVNPDGTQVVSTSLDGTLRIWDIAGWQGATGYEDTKFGSVLDLLFSPNGTILAANMVGGVLQLWDVRRGTKFGEPLTGHTDNCEAMAFGPDEKWLATGSKDQSVRLWSCFGTPRLQCLFNGHTSGIKCVAFINNTSRIASCSKDGDIRVWDFQSQSLVGVYVTGLSLSKIVLSTNGSQLAAYSTNHTITLWDTNGYKMIGHAVRHDPGLSSRPVQYLVFSPDQTKLVSYDSDKLKIFNISLTGLEEVGTLLMLGKPASPAFSSDNPRYIYLGHGYLDISHIPEEGLGIMHNTDLVHSTDFAHNGRWPSGIPRLYCTERSRKIHSYSTKTPLLIWPPDLPVETWAVYEDIVVLGTTDGRILLLKFLEDTAGLEVYHSASSGASAESAS